LHLADDSDSYPEYFQTKEGSSLVGLIQVEDCDNFPSETSAFINYLLRSNYPPLHDRKRDALKLVEALQSVIISIPLVHVIPMLLSMQEGLSVWIEDEQAVTTKEEYNLSVRWHDMALIS